MTTYSHLERFNLTFIATVQLISELNTNVYNLGHKEVNPMMFSLAEAYLKSMDKVTLLRSFVKRTMPYWKSIREKDSNFFIHNAESIFGEVKAVDLPGALKSIYTAVTSRGEPIIPYSDRDAIFNYFSSLIKISIKYLNENLQHEDIPIDIDINRECQLWGIKV